VALGLVFTLAGAGAASAGEIQGSRLAPRVVRADRVDSGLMAQRVIEREWGISEDSTYREVDVRGYRSEGWAMAMSGVVPGAGQFYVGETGGGFLFLLAEVAGWTSLVLFRENTGSLHDQSHAFAGPPGVPSSTWSFARYELAGGQDTNDLMQLYNADPDAFYHRVAYDDRYRAGWAYNPEVNRDDFRSIEKRWQRSAQRERFAIAALMFNHVWSALDALKAARDHNAPLERNLHLKMNSSLQSDGPAMTLALERSF
jgi:hypothetical protein